MHWSGFNLQLGSVRVSGILTLVPHLALHITCLLGDGVISDEACQWEERGEQEASWGHSSSRIRAQSGSNLCYSTPLHRIQITGVQMWPP